MEITYTVYMYMYMYGDNLHKITYIWRKPIQYTCTCMEITYIR